MSVKPGIEPKFIISGVFKSYGDNHVLKGIDLQVQDGESMVIIGPSACGKTLLLKCLIGLVRPDRGKILIDFRSSKVGATAQ